MGLAAAIAMLVEPCALTLAEEVEPAEAAVALEVVNREAAAAGDGELDPIIAMYRPVLKVELSFAKRVCNMSDEQLATAIKDCKGALTAFAAKEGKANVQQGIIVFHGGGESNPRPRQVLEELLQKKIAAALSEEQNTAYREELQQRETYRRDAITEVLLEGLTAKLNLSDEQRQKIREGIVSNWHANWVPELEMVENYGQHYFPRIPDKAIVPHLDNNQKVVWNGLQKVQFSSAGIGLNQNANVIDDVDLGQ